MRSLLLGAVSVVALLAPASVANAQTAGYVDLSLGQSSIEDEDLDTIVLGGAAAVDLSPNWRAQFDANVNRFSSDFGTVTLTNTAAHVYYEGDDWAVGGVLSNRDLSLASIWSLGLEAQRHFGPVVLEGEIGFGTLEAFGDSYDATNADADATFYASDNFSIGLGASYLDSEDAFGTITSYGIDAEYKFTGSANSIFAGYDSTNYDDIDSDGDAWRIGFRHAFGDDTLQGRRLTGPRWLPVRNDVTIFGMGPSDRRLKRDIILLATLENGMKLYSFRYIWSDTVYVGLMAQDLLLHREWRAAVVRLPNGFYVVNYAALGLRMTTLEEWSRAGLAAVVCAKTDGGSLRLAA